MNVYTVKNSSRRRFGKEAGTSLLEVLIAIVIFVVGMLALASLQGNLARSSSDANMRTVAANIAEETIENLRAFQVIPTTSGKKAYDDIVTKTTTTPAIGGVTYTVAQVVTPYYFLADRVSVSKTAPAGVTASGFKNVELTITWSGQDFQIGNGVSTSNRLGSGAVKVSSIIPAIPSLNNAKVAAEDDGAPGYPPVNYTPGRNPDIVALNLGNSKFKESTKPEPTVVRKDELVETWFDVITYSTNSNNSTFLRREEFASVSCECTLNNSVSNKDGLQPTVWNGAEYVEGASVGKQYGTVPNGGQQSQYCDVCCRDHHDTSRGPNSYRPWTNNANGNHKHYSRNNSGVLTEAAAGDNYIEACRLVRKDGFFRVAQDFNLSSQTSFPENYLDQVDEVTPYSTAVTNSVSAHYASGTAMPADFNTLGYPGSATDNRTPLPTTWTSPDNTKQQLRSRGIYTDELSQGLKDNLLDCFGTVGDPGVDRTQCGAPNANSALELYPFFDVQLTSLARWTTTPLNAPVTVTNEEIKTDNAHSRGKASLAGSGSGSSMTNSVIEKSNVGLISTLRVTNETGAVAGDSTSNLYIVAGGVVTPPTDPTLVAISGTISAEGGTSDAAVATVTGAGGAVCTKPTNNTFVCTWDGITANPTVTIGNFWKKNQNLIACANLPLDFHNAGDSAANNWTRYSLPTITTTGVTIVIKKGTSC